MTKKQQLWTCVEPEDIKKLDLICRKEYWTRTQCLRNAIQLLIKNHYQVPVENNVDVRDNRGAN